MRKSITRLFSASSTITVLACLSAAPAVAQAAADETATAGDIIVTAQKTATLASKTPLALTVLGAEDLQERGINDVADLRNFAPSVEIGNAAQGVNISVRGIGSTDLSSKGKQGVVFTVDNVPVGRPQVMGTAFFDLERVEVLRGPQGTLYGKSATGGVINLITAKPKDVFEASATFELGNFNTRRGEAMVNIPVSDNFALRAAANFNKRDGYLLPVLGAPAIGSQANLNDEDNWTARISGLLKFGETGRFVLTGTFGHVGGTGDVSYGALYSRFLANDGKGKAVREVFYNPMAGKLDDDFININGELSFELGPVLVTYDGAHIDFEANDNKFAGTGDPASVGNTYVWTDYRADITVDSHELRLSNADAGPVTWVVGANYWKERIDEEDMNWRTTTGTATCMAPTLSAACNSPNPHIVGPTGHKSTAAFGQVTWEVVDGLKLTGGLRYSRDSLFRDAIRAAGGAPAGGWLDANGQPCAPPNYCANGVPNTGRQKDNKLTWRLGVDYQIAPNQMIYASVATGYKAGGFNDVDPTTSSGSTAPYGAEELIAYEIGYKGRLLPSLQYNTSFYYYDYSKYQFTGATFLAALPGIPTGVLIYTTLVPAKAHGWENELNWQPSNEDDVSLSMTLASGKYKDGPQVGFIFSNQADWSGYRFDRLPKFTLSGSWEHRFPLAVGGHIIARINSRYSSGYLVSDAQGVGNPFSGVYSVAPAQYKQKSYTRTDLTLGYETESGKLRLEGFVRNLENEMQLLDRPNFGEGGTVRISEPRMFGARVTVKY